MSDCDEALKLDKDYLKAFLRRGRSYMEMEKYDEAIRDFEQINKMERGKIKFQIFLESHKYTGSPHHVNFITAIFQKIPDIGLCVFSFITAKNCMSQIIS